MTRTALVALLGLVAALTEPAAAQHPQTRSGFWFNLGLGYGSYGCEDCNDRLGSATGIITLGGSLSQKFLLGGSLAAWSKDLGGAQATVSTLTATIRFYPSATGGFFLTGGLGAGAIRLSIDNGGAQNERGFGMLLGLGYDIRVGSNVSITPFVNGLGVRGDNSDANIGQIGLGITTH